MPLDYPFISLGPAIHLITLVVLFALTAVGIGAAVVLAALPGRIAAKRHHPQAAAVNICGWLGLPTGILWVAAMVWAYWRTADGCSQDLNRQLNTLEAAVTHLENQQKSEGS